MNYENYDQEINKYINEIKNNHNAYNKQVKVAKLIVLLNKIEKELVTIESTLDRLCNLIQKNPNAYKGITINTIVNKKTSVAKLKNKIAKARLNLNYFFL